MTLAVLSAVALVVGLVLLMLLWRTVKLFARLALIGLVVLAVLAGLVAWGWLGSGADDDARPRQRDNRRATNSNARR